MLPNRTSSTPILNSSAPKMPFLVEKINVHTPKVDDLRREQIQKSHVKKEPDALSGTPEEGTESPKLDLIIENPPETAVEEDVKRPSFVY